MSLDLRALPIDVLTSARAGDRSALETIFRAAAGAIRHYARKRTRPDGMPFDDLVSVGRLAVFDAIRTYHSSKGHFFGWLCWWLDGRMLGATRPRSIKFVSTEDESAPEPVDGEALPDELLALHDDALALRRAVARLPTYEREAMRAYLEGLTFEEAGQRMGCTRETARQSFHAGLERLQLELAPGRPVAQLFSRASPGPARCGTRSRYNKGCRCQPCALANRAYQNRWERRRSA